MHDYVSIPILARLSDDRLFEFIDSNGEALLRAFALMELIYRTGAASRETYEWVWVATSGTGTHPPALLAAPSEMHPARSRACYPHSLHALATRRRLANWLRQRRDLMEYCVGLLSKYGLQGALACVASE